MTERILDMSSPGADVRARKTRASKPKVKTGCQTCKIRRVKCDETKPSCLRCLKFGHQCDGYLPRPSSKPCAGSSSNSRLLVPKSSSGSLSLLAQAHSQAQAQAILKREEEREGAEHTHKQPKLYPAPSQPTQTTQQLFSTPHEHHAFTHFCATTSQHLASANSNSSESGSSFTPSLWTSLMHRACETSPAIRSAVIALGGLNLQEPGLGSYHGNGHVNGNANSENGVGTLRHHLAFRQYSKALCYLRRDVAGGKHDLRTTLVASLLFYCFESMGVGVGVMGGQEGECGGGGGGVSQVCAGLKLIREWASSFYGAGAGAGTGEKGADGKIRDVNGNGNGIGIRGENLAHVENDIMRAFGGLEIQVMLYADGRTREAHEAYRRIGQAAVDDMSSIFPDLSSARSVLEIVIRRSMHWLRSTMHLHMFSTGPSGEVPTGAEAETAGQANLFFDVDSTFAERLTTLAEYERWDAAFSPLLNHARSRSAPHETFILASTLRLHWLAGYMSIDSNNSRSALVNHGKYTILLQELVGIARLLLDEQERERNHAQGGHETGNGTWTWTFDMQIIVPLLTVGWIYRHRTLRREAIELLLRSPRKEGVWDGVVVGKVMRWLAEIEDEGSDDGAHGDFVAEEAMARCIRMGFDDVRREASVSCLQPVKGSVNGEERRRSVIIP
ncbi:Beauvericin cluster-specific repressor, partial [Lachnellula occidentalis]